MTNRALVDTSVLVAFLVARDPHHSTCKTLLTEAPRPLFTTLAVATELFHFLVGNLDSVRKGWKLLALGGISISVITESDLAALETLMIRYADRPMDFADATLVHVAEREGISTIITLDHDDFETYRIGRKGRFKILPARDPA